MADTDEKKAKKAEKSAAARTPEQADQGREGRREGGQAQKGGKAAGRRQGGKPSRAPREPEPRVPARLKVRVRRGDPRQARRSNSATRTDADADARQGRHQYGHRRGRRRPQEGRHRRAADLALIAGQKAVVTKARKAIATFKLREGLAIGGKVTLRKARMYEFIDRLINIALPRVRDFRGLNPKSFDGRGNYALGLKEHIVFPEINYDKVDDVWGMDIIVCTTAAPTTRPAPADAFQFPFRQ